MKRSLCVIGLVVALSVPLANAGTIFSEYFDYENGPLTSVSAGVWYKHDTSVGVEQLQVENGAARLSFSNAEDVARNFDQNYTSGTLFYSTVMTMTTLPGTGGAYLMHLSDTDTGMDTDFFARLFVKSAGSGYQIGIRNRSLQANPSDYPVVYEESVTLALNTAVAVIVKFDFETMQSTLWINPVDQSSASVTDTFEVAFSGLDQSLSRIALRQASGIGNSSLDQILVGTTFDDVFVAVPEPATLALLGGGAAGLLASGAVRRRKKAARMR